MKLSEFQTASARTAIYPEHGTGSVLARTYCALGLVNETGEVAGKVKKALRDDGWTDDAPLSPERAQAVLDECGDVLWYLAQLHTENGETLPEPTPDQAEPPLSALPRMALFLFRHAVDLLEDEARARYYLVTVLDTICRMLGSDLEAVAEANIAKLTSRAQRGTLGGDGDER